MSDLSILFEPVKLGPLTLPNRWAMAPMTRQFSPNRTPTEDVARYYQRRAEGVRGSSSPRAQPFVISPLAAATPSPPSAARCP